MRDSSILQKKNCNVVNPKSKPSIEIYRPPGEFIIKKKL